jgi:hypothetical protein
MQWEEFTQFIIDTVEGDNDAKLDDVEDYNKTHKKKIKYKKGSIQKEI